VSSFFAVEGFAGGVCCIPPRFRGGTFRLLDLVSSLIDPFPLRSLVSSPLMEHPFFRRHVFLLLDAADASIRSVQRPLRNRAKLERSFPLTHRLESASQPPFDKEWLPRADLVLAASPNFFRATPSFLPKEMQSFDIPFVSNRLF